MELPNLSFSMHLPGYFINLSISCYHLDREPEHSVTYFFNLVALLGQAILSLYINLHVTPDRKRCMSIDLSPLTRFKKGPVEN